ncbi:hypothetical protein BDP27DRAFT_1444062 [Rhodocollybia butyracea]|uniref:Uncharacterized protein n=1 Tax=Rhodocollybia butyracea TaxID=206335 RepID=A0A9P5UBZ4_9AGAR|nr:hypothetical protein BDP27DRAFT_1444062 [Rhodocollybia butyracea]
MVRLNSVVVALALCVFNTGAVPVERRDALLDSCNNARLGVIGGLNSSSNALVALGASSSDPSVAAATSQALASIQLCQLGVATIVKGVLGGVTSDASGVPTITTGLANANTVIDGINSTDSNVQSNIASVLSNLNDTLTSGLAAIAQCAQVSEIADGTLSNSTSSNSSSVSNSVSNNNSGSSPNSNSVMTVHVVHTTTVVVSASQETQASTSNSYYGRRTSKRTTQCDSAAAAASAAFNTTAQNAQALANAAGNDQTTSSAAQTVSTFLTLASGLIGEVQSTGSNTAGASMGQNLLDAQGTLNIINSTDSSVNTALLNTQLSMIQNLHDAQELAIQCTPFAGGVAPGKRRRSLSEIIWG